MEASLTDIIPHICVVPVGQEEDVREDSRKTSGDGLDDYIRVSSPGLLIIIGAMLLVLVATVVWGFIGKIPVTTTVTGCVVDAEQIVKDSEQNEGADHDEKGPWVVCYVDSSKYSADQILQLSRSCGSIQEACYYARFAQKAAIRESGMCA